PQFDSGRRYKSLWCCFRKAGLKLDDNDKTPTPPLFQENVFIETSRPKYLEDLHTEALQGLKMMQEEGIKPTSDTGSTWFMTDSTIPDTSSVASVQSSVSTRSSRSGLTRQGSTFRPLNSGKKSEKTKGRRRHRKTVVGIPHHVQRELGIYLDSKRLQSCFQLGLDRVDWTLVPKLDEEQLFNGETDYSQNTARQQMGSESEEGTSANVPGMSIIQPLNKENVKQLGATHARHRDDLALLHHLGSALEDDQRPRSLAVPWLTTASSLQQELPSPVMSMSPQAAYMSKIIPNAVLPPSVDVVEISRGRSRSSVRTVSKSSLLLASSVRTTSSKVSTITSASRNNPPNLSDTSCWSNSDSSETLVSDSSTISNSSTPKQKRSENSNASAKENKIQSSISKAPISTSNGRLIVRGDEVKKDGQFARSLSVTKPKRAPPPPSRSYSLHSRMKRQSRYPEGVRIVGLNEIDFPLPPPPLFGDNSPVIPVQEPPKSSLSGLTSCTTTSVVSVVKTESVKVITGPEPQKSSTSQVVAAPPLNIPPPPPYTAPPPPNTEVLPIQTSKVSLTLEEGSPPPPVEFGHVIPKQLPSPVIQDVPPPVKDISSTLVTLVSPSPAKEVSPPLLVEVSHLPPREVPASSSEEVTPPPSQENTYQSSEEAEPSSKVTPPQSIPPPPPLPSHPQSSEQKIKLPQENISFKSETNTVPPPPFEVPMPPPPPEASSPKTKEPVSSIPINIPLPPPLPVQGHASIKHQPIPLSTENKSQEQTSAPVVQEPMRIVTPSLLQMVKLRSVSNTVSGEAPQKPIRRSLIMTSPAPIPPPETVPSQPTLTAARSKESPASRLSLPSPTSPLDLHKSPSSTASFIFSKSNKKVVIDPKPVLGAKEDVQKVISEADKGVRVPPPVAKKPKTKGKEVETSEGMDQTPELETQQESIQGKID
uniref:KIAA1522 n=1 Tax=Amphilophus citrinellus TaxID=61819 RepID=A0A3Q0SBW4_AMPCI